MSGSQAWLTVRNTRMNPFGGDRTSWTTEISHDDLLLQEVDIDRDIDHDWGILECEYRHESHVIQLPAEELSGLQRLVSQIDFDLLQEACSDCIDDVGWQAIECRTSDLLLKYRGHLLWGWHDIRNSTSPHIHVVKTAVELWETVVRLSPFKDLVRPRPQKRPRGPGRYRNS